MLAGYCEEVLVSVNKSSPMFNLETFQLNSLSDSIFKLNHVGLIQCDSISFANQKTT
jgi:hypothetical protein